MSHGQSTVNRGFSVNKEVAVENPSERSFMVTLNQLEALSVTNLKATSYVICWSWTELPFLSRRAEELSVPGKIA